MPMQLISERLLEREIKKYEQKEKLSGSDELFFLLCKKELAVIRKLEIGGIDMRGETEDVERRLDEQSIYFAKSHDFEVMKEKARRYDQICKIARERA